LDFQVQLALDLDLDGEAVGKPGERVSGKATPATSPAVRRRSATSSRPTSARWAWPGLRPLLKASSWLT
jgi:hypothetical protein